MSTPSRTVFPALLVLLTLATLVLGIVPLQFLVIGLRALGSAAGYWPAEATDNDGEGALATTIGVVAIGALTALALATAAALGPRWGRTRRRSMGFVCLLLIPAWVMLGLWEFWGSGAEWNPWS